LKVRLAAVLLAVLVLARFGAGLLHERSAAQVETPAAVAAQEKSGPRLSTPGFAALVARISEAGGYFDTDNLISNEASFLHVIGTLEEMGIRGGAYIGVGPDQNFSYIARTRPEIAFIIDIRRDNALQHLWFKALFELAPTRIEYLSLMMGRRPPRDPARWEGAALDRIIDEVSGGATDRAALDVARRRVIESVVESGIALSAADLATIGRIHARFAEAGFALRFTSHGRPPRSFYPTFADLLLETDRQGRRASYLASEQDYRVVRDLQRRNLIIPVVGDLAGTKALNEIGAVLRERGLRVSAFYASNVEFYLMQDRTFDRFARNLAALPAAPDALLIRSVFGRFYAHPQSVPGYYSTQLLQRISSLVAGFQAGKYRTYDDLVYGELVQPLTREGTAARRGR
jgi:hypothetical protein